MWQPVVQTEILVHVQIIFTYVIYGEVQIWGKIRTFSTIMRSVDQITALLWHERLEKIPNCWILSENTAQNLQISWWVKQNLAHEEVEIIVVYAEIVVKGPMGWNNSSKYYYSENTVRGLSERASRGAN